MGTTGPRTTVIALGSVLMADDAVGAHVLRRLEAGHELPPEVELLDLGTPGPELANHLEGLEAVVFVDTIHLPGAQPGEVHLLRRAEILRGHQPLRLSPHDPSLRGALVEADLLGRAPSEVLLVGVVPADTHLGLGLTPAVAAALPRAVAEVAAELRRLGHGAPHREAPLPVDLWWEKPAPQP